MNIKNATAGDNVEKREWIRPELQRLEAGSAESQKASLPDGGGGFQAS